MKRLKIGLFAACDRNNYGDILFPIIFKEYFRNHNYDFEYYGLKESNISSLGGPQTKALNMSLIDQNDFMIVAGGDTLSATWQGAGFCFIQNKTHWYFLKIIRKLFQADLNSYFKRQMAKDLALKMPYNISNLNYLNSKVLYNAVGGNLIKQLNPDDKQFLKEQLENSEYISVRANNVKNDLVDLGVNKKIIVSPDSAIIMSEIFSLERIRSNLSKSFQEVEGDYIVFQIGEQYARSSLMIRVISQELTKICSATGLKIVLLPIGRAPMHSDHIPLGKIYEECKAKLDIYIVEHNTIFDTMYTIANARAYIGTSLHGAITAFSFGIPHVALTKKVKKLIDFLETWSPPESINFIEISNLSSQINSVLTQDTAKIQEYRTNCINLVKRNFSEMQKLFSRAEERML